MELNEQQKEAVFSNASKIACLAGAGSGKTAVLVSRIARLVSEGVRPSSILVLTFTRAAATEMRGRYFKDHLGEECPEFRTFHSFCYSILSKDAEIRRALGFKSVPAIADSSDTKKIEQMAKLQTNTSLSLEQLKGRNLNTPKERYEYEVYRKAVARLMKAESLITFDELSDRVSSMFVNDDACIRKYKQMYKYILCDEYQDTDNTQHQFVMSFYDSDVFVVGDILQQIYSFRGTSSELMKSLIDDPAWKVIKLYRNYRSCQTICDYANRFTSYAEPQYRLELKSGIDGGEVHQHRIELGCDWDDPVDLDSIDDTVQQLKQKTLSGSTALLFRTNAEVDLMKGVLLDEGIEFVKSKRDSDAEPILKALNDNDYLIHWLSMYLNNNQYSQYLRLEAGKDSPMTASEFYDNFKMNPKVKYLADTVVEIRRILKSKDPVFLKCNQILKLLDMKEVDVDTAAQTPLEIVDYIREVVDEETSSDIYVGTIHSVKGLEFDNVFVFGAGDMRFRLDNEDNLNLFYVAVTRAKKYLSVWRC